jgi:hypothetical protein
MKQWAIVAGAALLIGCTERDQGQIMAEKLGVHDDKAPAFMSGIPSTPIKCTFEGRSSCIGADCRNLRVTAPPMYVEIDRVAGTYRRCGPKPGDCESHPITYLSQATGYQNVVIGEGGTLFKLGPTGRFTDIATLGPQVFVSEGKCAPLA